MSVRSCFAIVFLAVLFTTDATLAQVANPELEACRATGLIALTERPSILKELQGSLDTNDDPELATQTFCDFGRRLQKPPAEPHKP